MVEAFGAGYGESERPDRGSGPEGQRGGDAEVVLGSGAPNAAPFMWLRQLRIWVLRSGYRLACVNKEK